jgi:hypothetical protein
MLIVVAVAKLINPVLPGREKLALIQLLSHPNLSFHADSNILLIHRCSSLVYIKAGEMGLFFS